MHCACGSRFEKQACIQPSWRISFKGCIAVHIVSPFFPSFFPPSNCPQYACFLNWFYSIIYNCIVTTQTTLCFMKTYMWVYGEALLLLMGCLCLCEQWAHNLERITQSNTWLRSRVRRMHISQNAPCLPPTLLSHQINTAVPNWFRRRSFAVLNSSVRFGTWVERRLNRALDTL